MGKEKKNLEDNDELEEEKSSKKTDKKDKKKKKREDKESKEREQRGNKKWIVVVCLISVLLSLVFYLLSGLNRDREQGLFFGQQKGADLDIRNTPEVKKGYKL